VSAQPTEDARRLGRLLAAYRGNISKAEAARRAGISEARWEDIESGHAEARSHSPAVSPHTIAAMCVAVGVDIAIGLKLAGHDPNQYDYLLKCPPLLMHLRRPLSPGIAVYRAIIDAASVPDIDPRERISSIYRDVAAENQQLAERLRHSPPDERAEYWRGYADALSAVADEQQRIADMDAITPS
jgi:transcriptional regulator with XRE-family HTH domain